MVHAVSGLSRVAPPLLGAGRGEARARVARLIPALLPFRCDECNKTVSPTTYAAVNGVLFCKPHFAQLFKRTGNYDEAFGSSQRKHDFVK